jgi:hypothetical protein
LARLSEDLSKKTAAIKALELDKAADKERDIQMAQDFESITAQNERLKLLESDLRLCFGLNEADDLLQHVTRVSQDVEAVPRLERELAKLRAKLEETNRQLFESTG